MFEGDRQPGTDVARPTWWLRLDVHRRIETDVDRMREASMTAFIVALSGVVWPFLLGAGVGTCWAFPGRPHASWAER